MSLLLLSFGTILIGKREEVLAGQGSTFSIKGIFQRPPFYVDFFKKALVGTGILAAIMGVFSIIMYGGITAVDFMGTMVAGSIFAYLMHLLMAYVQETNKFKKEE